MKILVRGQQALATMVYLAFSQVDQALLTGPAIADYLGVSKIYLEQTLSLLRRSGLIEAVKGAQGGYRLAVNPADIAAADILAVAEPGLFEHTLSAGPDTPALSRVLDEQVYRPIDGAISALLAGITLQNLADALHLHQQDAGLMFYI